MSDAIQQQAAPVKVAKQIKKAAPKTKSAAAAVQSKHPKFREMILEAIRKLAERSGSSRQAIVKFVVGNFAVEQKQANQHIKVALKAGVKQGWLKQSKGVGASGSFRVGDAAKTVVKKAAAKPKVAKPQVAKKPAASSKPKKNVKKVVKPKAPKPASVAAPAAASAPVVVAKSAAKKPVAAKPVNKKASPSKKVVKAVPAKKASAPAKKIASPAKKVVKKAAPSKKAAPIKA